MLVLSGALSDLNDEKVGSGTKIQFRKIRTDITEVSTEMHERDLVGYGRNPPNPEWPGQARLAVNFVINIEEGAEPSIPDGDGKSEAGLTEVPSSPVPTGTRDLAAESMFEYGSRVGYWRLVRAFEERGLPVTAFACAQALERNPDIAASISQLGWDICAHGLRWVEHYKLDIDDERQQIASAVTRIESAAGIRPSGWYCRYGPSVNTRALLLEHGGFAYDSDAYNDELPYWIKGAGYSHLIVPYSLTHNDTKFPRLAVGTGAQFFEYLREAFDVLYEEGRTQPKMMSIGLHSRVIGHPGRSSGLTRFLDYVAEHDEVWITRRIDIAEHWETTHPPGSE
jgi:allantoinase